MLLALITLIVAFIVRIIWYLGVWPCARILNFVGINSLLFVTGAFARSVEVFLHDRFGSRYLLQPAGWLSPFLVLVWILLFGLVLRVPSLIVEQVATWDQTKDSMGNWVSLELLRMQDTDAETSITRCFRWAWNGLRHAFSGLWEGFTKPQELESIDYKLPDLHPTDGFFRLL